MEVDGESTIVRRDATPEIRHAPRKGNAGTP